VVERDAGREAGQERLVAQRRIMSTADLAATPTAREKQAFGQFPTAWRFALRNQTRNRLAGLLPWYSSRFGTR
jgi:hypothetical protein